MAVVGALTQAAGPSVVSPDVEWSRFDQARAEMTQAYAAFLQRAGEIIRDPLQPVS